MVSEPQFSWVIFFFLGVGRRVLGIFLVDRSLVILLVSQPIGWYFTVVWHSQPFLFWLLSAFGDLVVGVSVLHEVLCVR
jgi:hypothetical protein